MVSTSLRFIKMNNTISKLYFASTFVINKLRSTSISASSATGAAICKCECPRVVLNYTNHGNKCALGMLKKCTSNFYGGENNS